jgi:hypothetical protein
MNYSLKLALGILAYGIILIPHATGAYRRRERDKVPRSAPRFFLI